MNKIHNEYESQLTQVKVQELKRQISDHSAEVDRRRQLDLDEMDLRRRKDSAEQQIAFQQYVASQRAQQASPTKDLTLALASGAMNAAGSAAVGAIANNPQCVLM